MQGYDLIGDIHGYAEPLVRLLKRLGYRKRFGTYRHPHRQAIFVGDFVDRGPGQREVIDTVRHMVDAGAALAIMGNHELNALAYHTPDDTAPGEYLRRRTANNTLQHRAFLDEYGDKPAELARTLEWFQQLPLWLDLGELRVVHACWHTPSLAKLGERLTPERRISAGSLPALTRRGETHFAAAETVLKGLEVALPDGLSFRDKSGHERLYARVRWWLAPENATWRAACIAYEATAGLPERPLPTELGIGYGANEPPVFFGHYWMSGPPVLQAPNAACLDYSVAARHGGKLVAYRWDGETRLDSRKFVVIERVA